MSARTKRQVVIERLLPVMVPPRLGPASIPAEDMPDGSVRFSIMRGDTGTYRLCEDWLGRPLMVRQP
jgi:hypothetical protein